MRCSRPRFSSLSSDAWKRHSRPRPPIHPPTRAGLLWGVATISGPEGVIFACKKGTIRIKIASGGTLMLTMSLATLNAWIHS